MNNKIKTILGMISFLALTTLVYGTPISDVNKSDAGYQSIKKAIDGGYLSLLQNNSFQGQRTITRRELAVILDKLTSEIDGSGSSLSRSKLQELSHLSKSFKARLQTQDVFTKKTAEDLNLLKNEQKVLHYDISQVSSQIQNNKLQSELDKVKEELNTQKLYTWIGLGAGILGILL